MSVMMMETNIKWKVRETDEKASFRKEHRRMKNKNMMDVKREKKREINRGGTSRRK
jgi:hypothetical protein